MKRRKISFPEIAWLTASGLTLFTSIHSTVFRGWNDSLMFYLLTFFSLGMFLLRRRMRQQGSNGKQN